MMQWLLEHIHVYSGLPWYGSVIATVLVGRLVLIRMHLEAADTSGRMSVVTKHVKPLQNKMSEARLKGDQQGVAHATKELGELYKAAGVKPWRVIMPILIQMPLGFGIWRVTRGMADVPVPGLEVGGAAWFTDLTLADPYFILPVVTGLCTFLTFKVIPTIWRCIRSVAN